MLLTFSHRTDGVYPRRLCVPRVEQRGRRQAPILCYQIAPSTELCGQPCVRLPRARSGNLKLT